MNKFAAQLLSVALLSGAACPAGHEDCKFSSDRTANFTGPGQDVVVSAAAGSLKIRGDAAAAQSHRSRLRLLRERCWARSLWKAVAKATPFI